LPRDNSRQKLGRFTTNGGLLGICDETGLVVPEDELLEEIENLWEKHIHLGG
jgi:hypothetical protein